MAAAPARATTWSLRAISRPRSVAVVTSASTLVDATKQAHQPSPSRKKNGVMAIDSPISPVPSAPAPPASSFLGAASRGSLSAMTRLVNMEYAPSDEANCER